MNELVPISTALANQFETVARALNCQFVYEKWKLYVKSELRSVCVKSWDDGSIAVWIEGQTSEKRYVPLADIGPDYFTLDTYSELPIRIDNIIRGMMA